MWRMRYWMNAIPLRRHISKSLLAVLNGRSVNRKSATRERRGGSLWVM
jgi:hypothetical protein